MSVRTIIAKNHDFTYSSRIKPQNKEILDFITVEVLRKDWDATQMKYNNMKSEEISHASHRRTEFGTEWKHIKLEATTGT